MLIMLIKSVDGDGDGDGYGEGGIPAGTPASFTALKSTAMFRYVSLTPGNFFFSLSISASGVGNGKRHRM